MNIEIVSALEHRHVEPIRDPGVTTGDIKELVAGRSCAFFVLKMPDGQHVLAEVSERDFAKYHPSI